MAVLTAMEIYNVALTAGFTPDQAVTWTAIALAESNGVTDRDNAQHTGLWQIDATTGAQFGNLDDPLVNARAAYALSHRGTDLSFWSGGMPGNQDYRMFLPVVTTLTQPHSGLPAATGLGATAVVSNGAGANAEFAAAPGSVLTAQPAGYDQIDAGTGLGQVTGPGLDTDLDGLTDEFEKLAGTNVAVADTDSDGLTDAFELAMSHTDPLRADTDGDRVSDAVEFATGTTGGSTGTNPTPQLTDTDGDGISDAVETAGGLDPNRADTDDDGLSDSLETSLGLDARQVDTDHDGLSDFGEISYGLDAGVANVPVAAPAPAQTMTPTATSTAAGSDKVQTMLDAALAQVGDSYVFGVDVDPDDPDPSVFDCAEFTQWAAARVGVNLEGASYLQYLELKAQGLLIPVEQAAHTPGALVFHFSSEPVPGGGRPSEAHVAFSLGDGRTVEAASTKLGVTTRDIGERFEYAAVLPGMDVAAAADAGFSMPTAIPVPGTDASGLNVDLVMRGIMQQESGGDYKAENPTSTASGAYQYIDGTWDGYGGYQHASDAPPAVQDEKMRADVTAAYARLGDWERVIAAHFAGEGGQAGPKSDWGVAPGTPANHNPTIQDYVDGVLGHIEDLDPGALTTAVATPLPAATELRYDGIDLGAPMTDGGLDSDHDGLTDDFERMLKLDALLADSDHDGLTDGYEVMSSHSDALASDTDLDGLSDSVEVSLGLNPTLLDSDLDGLSDLAEMQFGGTSFGGPAPTGLPTAPEMGGTGTDVDLLLDDGGAQ